LPNVKTTSSGKRATNSARARSVALCVAFAASSVSVACSSKPTPQAATLPGASTVPLQPPIDYSFDSLDERPVSSQASRGKPSVLAFVTTGSLPAQAQVDFLVAMAKHDADRVNYVVVALEPPENRELVEIYRKSLAVAFPVALADATTLAGQSAFGDLSAVPVTVVLDRRGRVVWRSEGRVVKGDELRRALQGL
jgi:hypothetical protein